MGAARGVGDTVACSNIGVNVPGGVNVGGIEVTVVFNCPAQAEEIPTIPSDMSMSSKMSRDRFLNSMSLLSWPVGIFQD